jgi:hypothetical protein
MSNWHASSQKCSPSTLNSCILIYTFIHFHNLSIIYTNWLGCQPCPMVVCCCFASQLVSIDIEARQPVCVCSFGKLIDQHHWWLIRIARNECCRLPDQTFIIIIISVDYKDRINDDANVLECWQMEKRNNRSTTINQIRPQNWSGVSAINTRWSRSNQKLILIETSQFYLGIELYLSYVYTKFCSNLK